MDSPFICCEYDIVFILSMLVVKRVSISNCTDIVVYNCKSSTRLLRLNRYVKANTIFPNSVRSQLVGHLLGDGAMRVNSTSVNPYFYFGQNRNKVDYVLHVYSKLAHYCMQFPAFKSVIRGNANDVSLLLATRNYS